MFCSRLNSICLREEFMSLTYDSLGGALAQLLAYEIQKKGVMRYLAFPSEFEEGSIKEPIVVTFGSPYVGNRAFKLAFDHVSLNAPPSYACLGNCEILIDYALLF
jgi:hypothetical protein